MEPQRNAKLAYERLRQETDALLATSERLMAEMRGLIEQARELVDRHPELVAQLDRTKP